MITEGVSEDRCEQLAGLLQKSLEQNERLLAALEVRVHKNDPIIDMTHACLSVELF